MKVNNVFDLCNPREVDAIMPAYDENGANISYLILSNGERLPVDMNVRKFLDKWLAHFKLTLHGCHIWASLTNNYRKLNPILVNKDIIMLPVKVRNGVSPKDGSYAYVKYASIEDVDKDHIVLANGTSINYISKYITIDKKMKEALLLKYIHIDETRDLISK